MNGEVKDMSDTRTDGFTAALMERTRGLSVGELPAPVATVAKHCLLDWFGVALAGVNEPLVRKLLEQAEEDGSRPAATVVGAQNRFSARQAALVNGAMGHAVDYDDVNIAAHGHVTAAVLPAALAVAEARHLSGDQLLRAFVAGYEATVMLGRYVSREHYHRGFHATATLGCFGAATAGALLMGLDDEAFARALGIAGTQAAGLKAQFGTMCKPFHAGKASENGVLGVQLAARGFTSRHDILECVQGFAFTQSSGGRVAEGLAPARVGAHVTDNLFKFSAACFGTHGAIEAGREARERHGVTPDHIRKVVLRVEAGADRMCNIAEPRSGLEAKFSLRFNAALALAGEATASPGSYSDEAVRRADLCALRDRVVVEIMGPDWPLPLTEVEIELTSGKTLHLRHDTGVPATDLDRQQERVLGKFMALARPQIGPARADRLAARLLEIERVPEVGALLEIVR